MNDLSSLEASIDAFIKLHAKGLIAEFDCGDADIPFFELPRQLVKTNFGQCPRISAFSHARVVQRCNLISHHRLWVECDRRLLRHMLKDCVMVSGKVTFPPTINDYAVFRSSAIWGAT